MNSSNVLRKTKLQKIISFFVLNGADQTWCFDVPQFPIFSCLCCMSPACIGFKVRTIIVNKKVGAFFLCQQKIPICSNDLGRSLSNIYKDNRKNKWLFLKQTYSHLRRDALKSKLNATNGIIYCNIRVQIYRPNVSSINYSLS